MKDAFTSHLEETEGHVERLEEIFEKLGKRAGGKTCKAMQGIVEEGKETMEEDAEPEGMDAALIAAAQRAEHYEMAAYGTVRTYAKLLGDEQAAKLLQSTLDEEGAADKKLTKLAETSINVDAEHHPHACPGSARGPSVQSLKGQRRVNRNRYFSVFFPASISFASSRSETADVFSM